MSIKSKRGLPNRIKTISMLAPFMLVGSVQSMEFRIGGIEGSFDSQLSLGSSWRVESQSDSLLLNSSGADNLSNSDDGNRNYQDGDAFSQLFKGSHDLEFRYQNFGGFVRGKYWYDSALENNGVDFGHNPTADRSNVSTSLDYNNGGDKLDDSGFNDLSKASGVALLDAFIYGEFDVLDRPLDVRLGKQVVSWGESTFIRGGVNSINPIDVNAFVRPGAEIKEGLLPVNMAYANVGLTDNLSLESFYQLEFQETVIPGCGTYFATNDYAPEGCNAVSVLNGQYSVARSEDGNRLAKDDGQFGVAFRYLSEALGDTEFGIYAMNIHSRSPLASGIKTTTDSATLGATANAAATNYIVNFAVNPAAPTAQEQATAALVAQDALLSQKIGSTYYFVEYPEDIQITGLSFATNVGSMALSGEISHKVDAPIQINGPMIIGTLVTDASSSPELTADFTATGLGQVADGYRLFDISQVQVTGIKFLDRVGGAARMTLIGEAGYTYIHGFKEGPTEIKYGRSDIFGTYNPADPASEDDGFVTEASWGYRARLVADYPDAFMGINLQPVIAWSHDVEGYSPQPGGNFTEGQQSLGLTLNGTFMATYSGSIGYTRYMGGKYSVIKDHDFASISVGMQF